jgi:O-antigen/teichoic acid export membrane protein
MKENLWLGFIFNLNQCISMLRAASEQLVLQWVRASRALGEYAVGLRIANGFNVLPSAIQTVYLPSLHAAQTLEKQVSLFAKLFRLTIVSGGLVLGMVFWAADDVVAVLFSREYTRSAEVLKILAVWLLINFISYPYSMLAEAVRKVGQRCFAQTISTVVAIVSGFCLVRWLGSVGAALSDCIASFVLFTHYNVILGRLAFSALCLRKNLGAFIAIVAASICVCGVRLLLPHGIERIICITATYGIVYVAVCLGSKVLTSADLAFGRLVVHTGSAIAEASSHLDSTKHEGAQPHEGGCNPSK